MSTLKCFPAYHGTHIGIMALISVSWHLYRYRGTYIGIVALILVSWHLYRYHGTTTWTDKWNTWGVSKLLSVRKEIHDLVVLNQLYLCCLTRRPVQPSCTAQLPALNVLQRKKWPANEQQQQQMYYTRYKNRKLKKLIYPDARPKLRKYS